MLFRQSFYRELTFSVLGIFLILTSIGLIRQIIILLNQAAAGTLALDGIVILLGFGLLQYIPTLLTISLYLAVFLVISRLYRDREMLVWLSAGTSLANWLRSALCFSFPVVIVIGSLSLVLAPWAIGKSDEFRRYLEMREDLTLIHPGSFTDLKRAEGILFVADLNPVTGMVHDIFMEFQDKDRQGVILAQDGKIQEETSGERYLLLKEGQRYSWFNNSDDFEWIRFSEIAKLIELSPVPIAKGHIKSDSSLELLLHPNSNTHAELFWRVSLPLSAILLVSIALPLGRVDPRSGRSWNLVIAILLFAVYNNTIGIGQAWIGQGKISLIVGVLMSHGLMLGITITLYQKHNLLVNLKKLLAFLKIKLRSAREPEF